MREMTPEEKLQARRDNVIIAARTCVETDFAQTSQAILRVEVAKLDHELQLQKA